MKQAEDMGALGAPGSDLRHNDESMHADLAHANLARVRGDFAEAEEICVKVLEAQPESAAAHEMLGDIMMAQNRFEPATDHYDIAQSLDPFAPDITRKLNEARARRQTVESDTTALQLGLPPRRPMPWRVGVFGVIGAVAFFTIVILVAHAQKAGDGIRGANAPIQATIDTIANRPKLPVAPTTTTEAGVANSSPSTDDKPATASGGNTGNERSIFDTVAKSSVGSRLAAVTEDPRAKAVTLTYTIGAGDDPRKVGAELAKAALERAGDSLTVTVRALRNGELIYMADIPRARYDETLNDTWQKANEGDDAWIAYCMTNEWPVSTTPTSTASTAEAEANAGGTASGQGR